MGGGLLAEGVRGLAHADVSWAGALAGVLVLDGAALVVGALTPVAAVLAATVLLSRTIAPGVGTAAGDGSAIALVIAIAVGLLGPGAYSVDARLFGRREIEVPRLLRDSRAHGVEPSE